MSLGKTKMCAIDGCEKTARARGLCTQHYHRWERHGDPLGGRVDEGEPLRWLKEHSSYEGEECLTWPFSKDSRGVGNVYFQGKTLKASRLMCMIAHGEPPDPSYESAHSCGRGHFGCVNRKHLRWATPSENQMDRVEHGTSNRGSRNGQALLTEAQVAEIKRALAAGKQGKKLASEYAVSPMTISTIKNGTRWGWVRA